MKACITEAVKGAHSLNKVYQTLFEEIENSLWLIAYNMEDKQNC